MYLENAQISRYPLSASRRYSEVFLPKAQAHCMLQTIRLFGPLVFRQYR